MQNKDLLKKDMERIEKDFALRGLDVMAGFCESKTGLIFYISVFAISGEPVWLSCQPETDLSNFECSMHKAVHDMIRTRKF
jgi:hypothetical protein